MPTVCLPMQRLSGTNRMPTGSHRLSPGKIRPRRGVMRPPLRTQTNPGKARPRRLAARVRARGIDPIRTVPDPVLQQETVHAAMDRAATRSDLTRSVADRARARTVLAEMLPGPRQREGIDRAADGTNGVETADGVDRNPLSRTVRTSRRPGPHDPRRRTLRLESLVPSPNHGPVRNRRLPVPVRRKLSRSRTGRSPPRRLLCQR